MSNVIQFPTEPEDLVIMLDRLAERVMGEGAGEYLAGSLHDNNKDFTLGQALNVIGDRITDFSKTVQTLQRIRDSEAMICE